MAMIDDDEVREIPVTDLKVGSLVDLESCPHLKNHATAPFMYAEVVAVDRETPDCVAVTYEGIDQVGYDPGTRLKIKIEEDPE